MNIPSGFASATRSAIYKTTCTEPCVVIRISPDTEAPRRDTRASRERARGPPCRARSSARLLRHDGNAIDGPGRSNEQREHEQYEYFHRPDLRSSNDDDEVRPTEMSSALGNRPIWIETREIRRACAACDVRYRNGSRPRA